MPAILIVHPLSDFGLRILVAHFVGICIDVLFCNFRLYLIRLFLDFIFCLIFLLMAARSSEREAAGRFIMTAFRGEDLTIALYSDSCQQLEE